MAFAGLVGCKKGPPEVLLAQDLGLLKGGVPVLGDRVTVKASLGMSQVPSIPKFSFSAVISVPDWSGLLDWLGKNETTFRKVKVRDFKLEARQIFLSCRHVGEGSHLFVQAFPCVTPPPATVKLDESAEAVFFSNHGGTMLLVKAGDETLVFGTDWPTASP